MKTPYAFQSKRLVGRPPTQADATLYSIVFGTLGLRELQRNIQDFDRYNVAPWTLQSVGQDIGVGGFRIGLGPDEGIEMLMSLSPDQTQIGLAGEFLADALLFVQGTLRADRIFSFSDQETTFTPRMLIDAGFADAGAAPIPGRPDRRIMRWTAANPRPASPPHQS